MRPETKAAYPKNWPQLSWRVKVERDFTCENCGQKGNKGNPGEPGMNFLTVHHLDYNPANCAPSNLVVLCQSCHLRLQNGELPRLLALKRGQLELWLEKGGKA